MGGRKAACGGVHESIHLLRLRARLCTASAHARTIDAAAARSLSAIRYRERAFAGAPRARRRAESVRRELLGVVVVSWWGFCCEGLGRNRSELRACWVGPCPLALAVAQPAKKPNTV